MELSELFTVLDAVLPGKVVYEAWPVGQAPPLPFICYMATTADNFGADNVVYHGATTVQIELYTEHKDRTTEASLESALTSAGLFWLRDEVYLSDEHCFQIIYEVSI